MPDSPWLDDAQMMLKHWFYAMNQGCHVTNKLKDSGSRVTGSGLRADHISFIKCAFWLLVSGIVQPTCTRIFFSLGK